MSRVNDQSPARTPDIDAWIQENIAEQERRHAQIVADMEALSADRERWIREFFERLQTTGYNFNGDQKRRIRPEQLPGQPDRPHKVTY